MEMVSERIGSALVTTVLLCTRQIWGLRAVLGEARRNSGTTVLCCAVHRVDRRG